MDTAHITATQPRTDAASRLRQATKPENWDSRSSVVRPALKLLEVVLWVVAIVVLLQAGLWLSVVVGLWLKFATFKARERLLKANSVFGVPPMAVQWLIPFSLLLPQILALPGQGTGNLGTSLFAVAGCGFTLLLESAPWFKRLVRHAQVSLGWSASLNNHTVDNEVYASELDQLTHRNSPERWEKYQSELEEQLTSLSGDWELIYGRNEADVLAVGSGGVVGIYNADLDGYVATVQEAIVDDDLLEEASVALRETPGYPVFGSRAWYSQEQDMSVDAVSTINIPLLEEATQQPSELVDGDGVDFGFRVPTLPSKDMVRLSTHLGMSAEHSPVTLIVAHGLQMDTPWARVQVRNGIEWLGTAVVCHPRYVADCIAALPGMFGSKQQIADAQSVVDLRTR